MAKIFRAAYIFNGGSALANVQFSGWVQEQDKDALIEHLNSVQPGGEGNPEGVMPVILGWEKSNLQDLE